jgi:hypothetical protein
MKLQLLKTVLVISGLALAAVANAQDVPEQDAQEECPVVLDPLVEERNCACLLRMLDDTSTSTSTSTLTAAADEQIGRSIEERSCDCLARMLDEGASAEDVVRVGIDADLDLAESTLFAMGCGGEDNQVAIAIAGVRLASNLSQAQTVANAVLANFGETGEIADAVREAVRLVARDLPQPGVFVDEYIPTGSDVSPAS